MAGKTWENLWENLPGIGKNYGGKSFPKKGKNPIKSILKKFLEMAKKHTKTGKTFQGLRKSGGMELILFSRGIFPFFPLLFPFFY